MRRGIDGPEAKKRRIAYIVQWQKDNPDKAKLYRRKTKLKRIGTTVEEVAELLTKQNGKCAICGTEQPGKSGWHTDHNHNTKVVRGLLCHRCNVGLGHFKDDIELLKAAILYVGTSGQCRIQ